MDCTLADAKPTLLHQRQRPFHHPRAARRQPLSRHLLQPQHLVQTVWENPNGRTHCSHRRIGHHHRELPIHPQIRFCGIGLHHPRRLRPAGGHGLRFRTKKLPHSLPRAPIVICARTGHRSSCWTPLLGTIHPPIRLFCIAHCIRSHHRPHRKKPAQNTCYPLKSSTNHNTRCPVIKPPSAPEWISMPTFKKPSP